MNQDLETYYRERAKEYDKVYLNPPEQPDLRESTAMFQRLFAGKNVLEIACGTGYWTECIAQTATSVWATDINESVLDIARERPHKGNVNFALADMFQLEPGRKFDALFGGFIWSHILLQDLDQLLDSWKRCLEPGAVMAFIDSNQLEGTLHDVRKITKTDEQGNTFQARTLENGTTHLVLKNFPTQEFLHQKLSRIASDIEFTALPYYWIVTARLHPNAPIAGIE